MASDSQSIHKPIFGPLQAVEEGMRLCESSQSFSEAVSFLKLARRDKTAVKMMLGVADELLVTRRSPKALLAIGMALHSATARYDAEILSHLYIAKAYEQLGKVDRASAYFERVSNGLKNPFKGLSFKTQAKHLSLRFLSARYRVLRQAREFFLTHPGNPAGSISADQSSLGA